MSIDSRTQTLQALEEYVSWQRAQMEQAQRDLEKLVTLRERARKDPVGTYYNLGVELAALKESESLYSDSGMPLVVEGSLSNDEQFSKDPSEFDSIHVSNEYATGGKSNLSRSFIHEKAASMGVAAALARQGEEQLSDTEPESDPGNIESDSKRVGLYNNGRRESGLRLVQSCVIESTPSLPKSNASYSPEHLSSQDASFTPPLPATINRQRGKQKASNQPRTETFNLPWSLSEQHLLERLLKEVPAGEHNRWVKISQLMGGRRTSRQVASRVQKYFLKLKKFGVNEDN